VHGEQSNDVQPQQTTKHKGDLAEDLAKLNSQFKDLVDKAYPDMKATVLEARIEARKDLEKRANARSSETRNQPAHTSGGSEGGNRQSQTLVSIKHEVIDLDEELQKRDETIQELQERDETIKELQEANQTMEEPSLSARQPRPTLCLPPRATPTEANKKRRGAPLKAELPLPHVMWVPIAENQWEWVDYNSVCEELTTIISDDLVKILVRDEGKRKEWASMTRNCTTWLNKPECFSASLFGKGNTKSTWNKANGDRTRACDTCVKKKRPCVRMVRPNPGEVCAVGWAPLPDSLRGALRPEDKGFWVAT
jgi:hypothetical protein